MKTKIILRTVIEMKLKLLLQNWTRIEIIAKPEQKLKLQAHIFVPRTEIMHHYGMY